MARLSFGFPPHRRHVLCSALVTGALLLAACASPPAPTTAPTTAAKPAAGTTQPAPSAGTSAAAEPAASSKPIVVAVSTEPNSLDPQATNDEASRVVTGDIFEMLIDRDSKAQLVPRLATSWEPAGQTTWRLKLRTGVSFHNGEPFNAEAAAYSLNRIIDKNFKTQRTSYIEGITGAKAIDATTLEVTTQAPDPVLPIRLTSIPMVPPKAAALWDFNHKLDRQACVEADH